MDFLAHGLWTNVAFLRQERRGRLLAVLFGILPDAPFLPVVLMRLLASDDIIHGPVPPDPFVLMYRATHSLLVFVVVALVVWLWREQKFWWPLAGWALHIGIDIFTHSEAYFPTLFLWPVSDWHISGISWAEPGFLLVNYATLALVYLAAIIWRRQKVKVSSTQP